MICEMYSISTHRLHCMFHKLCSKVSFFKKIPDARCFSWLYVVCAKNWYVDGM